MSNYKNSLTTLPLEDLLKVSETLNVEDTRSLIFTCQDLYESKVFVLLQKLPDLYGIPGQSLQSVFFPFSHPDWTPWKLEPTLSYALHKTYFEAMLLKIPSVQTYRLAGMSGTKYYPKTNQKRMYNNPKIKEIIQLKYFLLYSVACGGHLDAAMQAGQMLLNHDFNEIIPTITAFGHLMPEAKEWDLRRLNQAQTKNTELEKIMKKVENFAEKQEDSETFTVKEVNFMKEILTELSKIKETDEVKAVKLLFGEMVEAGEKELLRDLFKPEKTIQFIKKLEHITPLLQDILAQEEPEETEPSRTLEPLANIPSYTGILNFFLMEGHAEILESVACDKTQASYPRQTPEGLDAVKKMIELERARILLGENCNINLPSSLTWQTFTLSPEDYEKQKDSEDCINTFLYHLVLTRNPASQIFKNIKKAIQKQLKNGAGEYEGGLANLARFDMLCKAFSGSSANNG